MQSEFDVDAASRSPDGRRQNVLNLRLPSLSLPRWVSMFHCGVALLGVGPTTGAPNAKKLQATGC